MVPHFSIYMISNKISQLLSDNGNFCLLMLEILIYLSIWISNSLLQNDHTEWQSPVCGTFRVVEWRWGFVEGIHISVPPVFSLSGQQELSKYTALDTPHYDILPTLAQDHWSQMTMTWTHWLFGKKSNLSCFVLFCFFMCLPHRERSNTILKMHLFNLFSLTFISVKPYIVSIIFIIFPILVALGFTSSFWSSFNWIWDMSSFAFCMYSIWGQRFPSQLCLFCAHKI